DDVMRPPDTHCHYEFPSPYREHPNSSMRNGTAAGMTWTAPDADVEDLDGSFQAGSGAGDDLGSELVEGIEDHGGLGEGVGFRREFRAGYRDDAQTGGVGGAQAVGGVLDRGT